MNTNEKKYLILRTTERSGCLSGTVLEVQLGVCTWENDAPRSLDGYDHSMSSIVLETWVYSDHPEWGDMPEIRADGLIRPRIEELRGIVKLGDTIKRKLEKIEAQAGAAGSFGAAALRFANSVGAVGIIRRSPRSDMGEWQQLDSNRIAYCVDSVVTDFRKKFAPESVAA